MQITRVSDVKAPAVQSKQKAAVQTGEQHQGVQQFSSDCSKAFLSYGLAKVNFGRVQKTQSVQSEIDANSSNAGTINLFYFSDTHGELAGLAKLASAKDACAQYCGGQDNLTVLGAGDLISGRQEKVISATVDIVNQMGMQATALGNHERYRSDESLKQLADDLKPELLAINATADEKANCSVMPSMICKQGNQEFITVGAQPLSPIDDPAEIAKAIDVEVTRIKEERKAQGLSDNLPVVFLSHMGSDADKIVAENSDTVNLILGGHTHKIEDNSYVSKNGRNVEVLQCGANNALAAIVKMDIAEDGTITTSSKMLDLNNGVDGICSDLESLYKTDVRGEAVSAAKKAESLAEQAVENNVGKRVDIAQVPEGYGYNTDSTERNYCNPVANIMADAMLEATRDRGAQVAFCHAPTVKDTAVYDNRMLTNYDIIGRMVPFGGNVHMADLSIDKFYQIFEEKAQCIYLDESQLVQCSGMTYSVDADKAKARHEANLEVMRADKAVKEAAQSGDTAALASAKAALQLAKEAYDALPGCVEKMMILNDDGSELKINPKAISRGDYDGQTIKCAMIDFLATETLGNGVAENTNIPVAEIFENQMKKVSEDNDGVIFIDQNDNRIAINDPNGLITGYALDTSLHTKHWYK
ncbi:MAG: metallophosphoesterase [Candidatus Gastranaerophilaceae bacterium]